MSDNAPGDRPPPLPSRPPPLPPAFAPSGEEDDDFFPGIWRVGEKIVLLRGEELPPDRCVTCDRPAEAGLLRMRLAWYPPVLVVVCVLNPLIGFLVLAVVTKRATLMVPLCHEHRAARRRFLTIAWCFLPASGVFLAAAIHFREPWLTAPFGGLLLTWLVLLSIGGRRPVKATRIDGLEIHLRGAGPEYCARFPTRD